MTLGYICQTHGYQRECDVDESGERVCYECGVAMTGLTGHTRGRRAPPSDEPSQQMGTIRWAVSTGYGDSDYVMVDAFDFTDAVERAIERTDDTPRNVEPARREYRR